MVLMVVGDKHIERLPGVHCVQEPVGASLVLPVIKQNCSPLPTEQEAVMVYIGKSGCIHFFFLKRLLVFFFSTGRTTSAVSSGLGSPFRYGTGTWISSNCEAS